MDRYRYCTVLLGALSVPAAAAWHAGTPSVAAAASDPRIAGALIAVDAIDRAATGEDPAAFTAWLAADLAVNNPQNGVSVRGATARRSAAGMIRYTRYDRTIEYAGLRGDMVLLMGEEIVSPRESGAATPAPGSVSVLVRRRFTDLWKQVDGRWRLTARQATIVDRP